MFTIFENTDANVVLEYGIAIALILLSLVIVSLAMVLVQALKTRLNPIDRAIAKAEEVSPIVAYGSDQIAEFLEGLEMELDDPNTQVIWSYLETLRTVLPWQPDEITAEKIDQAASAILDPVQKLFDGIPGNQNS